MTSQAPFDTSPRVNPAKLVAAPGRIARNTSVSTRLSLIAVLVSLVSLVITSVVGLQRGSGLADDVLRERLATIGESRADEVERYLASLQRSVVGQAISPTTADAIEQFASAYRELQGQEPAIADNVAVASYYSDVVAPRLADVRGRPVSTAGLVPHAPAAVHLQANYVVAADFNDDGLIGDAGDDSSWTEVHLALRESFEDFVVRSDVDDFYLIEPDNSVVVYSTAKGIEFATSLLTGPQSGTALAALINSFPNQPEPGVAAIADFARYPAAGDEPSLFVASPVFSDGGLAGYVALRIGTGQLTSITTSDASWQALGETGEAYVVASDDLMRSDARGFIEDSVAYFDAVTAAQTATEDQVRSMEQLGTTVLLQQANDVDAALSADSPRLVQTTNYLGADVLSSQRPLEIDGLEWVMFAEVEREEVEQPIADFVRNLLIAIAVFIVVITFLAVRWSDRLLLPLRIISTRLREAREGSGAAPAGSSQEIPANSPAEFTELGADIDTMLETLAARNADAEERASERRGLLRRILPPHVVRRAEAGDRDVLDQVPNATVAVVVLRGLGALLQDGSSDDARTLLDDFILEADALAAKHGLDRIRLTGDAYFAACGTKRPHLDHAQRAAAFVLDVGELIHHLDDGVQVVAMSAGLDSGPITVGLTGGSRLVYDAWGPTVRTAADLVRRAGPGEILASAATRSQLPENFMTEDRAELGDQAVVLTGRLTDTEPIR